MISALGDEVSSRDRYNFGCETRDPLILASEGDHKGSPSPELTNVYIGSERNFINTLYDLSRAIGLKPLPERFGMTGHGDPSSRFLRLLVETLKRCFEFGNRLIDSDLAQQCWQEGVARSVIDGSTDTEHPDGRFVNRVTC